MQGRGGGAESAGGRSEVPLEGLCMLAEQTGQCPVRSAELLALFSKGEQRQNCASESQLTGFYEK